MSKFLILCDLDSTLLRDDKSISKKTIRFIKKITDEGHIFCLSTGRPLQATLKYQQLLGISCPIVTENGSNIYYPKSNMENDSFLIPKEKLISLLESIDPFIVSCFCGSEHFLYLQNKDKIPFWIIHNDGSFKEVDGKVKDTITEDPFLPSIIVKKEHYEDMIKALARYPEINYRYWGDGENGCTFELFSSAASKGKALRFLKHKFSIDDDKTIAFGDQLNDSSMICEAFYGVAMKNGVNQLKIMARMISSKDNNHNGVKKTIKKIFRRNHKDQKRMNRVK